MIRIGTAGWGIATRHAADFPAKGTHLERYSQVLAAAEIDTSFYRHHQRQTYARWSHSVPESFRFAVKTPRALTQPGSLVLDLEVMKQFAAEVAGLGERLAVVLVQLAPRVAFEQGAAQELFARLRECIPVAIVCEPRHESWGDPRADELLRALQVARVAADPPRWPGGEAPGGSTGCTYFRMHGAPRTYYSDYPAQRLADLAVQLIEAARQSSQVWCILDNTALGHALGNALALQQLAAGLASEQPK